MIRTTHLSGQIASSKPRSQPILTVRHLAKRDGRGAAAAEFAVFLPVILLMFVGTVQYGIMMFTYNTMLTAARAGARAVAIGSADGLTVATIVKEHLPAWVDPSLVTVQSTSLSGDRVRVDVSIPANNSTVIRLGPMPDTINADVVMLRES